MERDEILAILGRAYFGPDRHEKAIVAALPRLLRRARLFIDVGASLGQYTYFADAAMHGGEIVAIEADPLRAEALEKSCFDWASSSTNRVEVIHAAAGDIDGEARFFVTDSNVSGGTFPHPAAAEGVRWREVVVPGITLDRLLAGRSPDLVKIDVEGGELRVLAGARRLLAAGRAKFLVELHPWKEPGGHGGPEEVIAFMAAAGYRPTDFFGRTLFVRLGSWWWWRDRVRRWPSLVGRLAGRLARALGRRLRRRR